MAKGSRGTGFPGDIVLVALLGVWTIATGLGAVESPAQTALGLVAVLFAPGYALVAALFPRTRVGTVLSVRADEPLERAESGDTRTITLVERLVLSLGLSVCIVPLLGIGLNFTVWGIRPVSFLTAIGTTTLVLSVVAVVRRFRVTPDQRYAPRLVAATVTAARKVRSAGEQRPLTPVLVVGFVVAAGGIGFAAASSERGERFTEFYLVTEDPETGEFVAGGYPEEIPPGEERTVHVGIKNLEGETTDYTVVVLMQSMGADGEIREQRRVETRSATVLPGQTWREPTTIGRAVTGEDVRVTFLLYVGEAPADATPSADNAYRTAHIWVDVPPSG